MRRTTTILTTLALAATAGCRQAPAPVLPPDTTGMPTQAQAARIADATVAAWASKDAARIKALYAPTVVGFDYGGPGLSSGRATWDKRQDAFAASGLNRFEQQARTIQVIDADVFVVSGEWRVSANTDPQAVAVLRCTDVHARDANGKWPIVNEHCSFEPQVD